ncbi:MAG: sugar phosphate isomerase/epimerase [Candidatus Nanohaloarchaeota archaeon QJJ-5]|nr:sugar phosphate isomerase/epimerase [Candidatus Nanohaloarchaeota archaeon QJJ-5]
MSFGTSVGPMLEPIDAIECETDFIEIAIGEHEIVPTELDIAQLRDELDERGDDLVVHLPFRQPMATSVEMFNEAFLSYMDQLLTSIAPLDPTKAVVHASCRDPERQEERDRLEKQIRELEAIGKSHDVQICHENVGNFDGPALNDLAAMIAETDARMCLDTGHAFDEAGQEGLEDIVATYPDLIDHVHLQDTRPGQDLHMPIGAGEIEFDPLGEHLSADDTSICLELFTDDHDLRRDSMRRARRLF